MWIPPHSLEVARPKRLYFISTAVLNLLLQDEREQLKVTATGLKVSSMM